MRGRVFFSMALLFGFLAVAFPVFAHHGTANYDTTRMITVSGVATGFEFVNPHVQIYWDAKDDSGTVQHWQGELTSPNHLERVGWTRNSIKSGDALVISGYPTKSGSHEIWIQKVMIDGKELSTTSGN